MSLTQTGIAIRGETGKLKNCNSWAEYETPHSSATANMCNGGWYKGEYYNECQSKADCLAATVRKNGGMTADGKRYLPVHTNEAKPFSANPGSTIVGGTPNLGDALRSWGDWRPSMPATAPKSDPRQQQQQKPTVALPSPMQVPVPLPYPVQPPSEWPTAMHTAYAGPTPVMCGGMTPTFLPQNGESIFSRLGKNIVQGWIGATGWQLFDFARTVDMFGRKPNT